MRRAHEKGGAKSTAFCDTGKLSLSRIIQLRCLAAASTVVVIVSKEAAAVIAAAAEQQEQDDQTAVVSAADSADRTVVSVSTDRKQNKKRADRDTACSFISTSTSAVGSC